MADVEYRGYTISPRIVARRQANGQTCYEMHYAVLEPDGTPGAYETLTLERAKEVIDHRIARCQDIEHQEKLKAQRSRFAVDEANGFSGSGLSQ